MDGIELLEALHDGGHHNLRVKKGSCFGSHFNPLFHLLKVIHSLKAFLVGASSIQRVRLGHLEVLKNRAHRQSGEKIQRPDDHDYAGHQQAEGRPDHREAARVRGRRLLLGQCARQSQCGNQLEIAADQHAEGLGPVESRAGVDRLAGVIGTGGRVAVAAKGRAVVGGAGAVGVEDFAEAVRSVVADVLGRSQSATSSPGGERHGVDDDHEQQEGAKFYVVALDLAFTSVVGRCCLRSSSPAPGRPPTKMNTSMV